MKKLFTMEFLPGAKLLSKGVFLMLFLANFALVANGGISEPHMQEKTITGTVTTDEDNTGLPGVNVILKGTSIGTVTDIEGNYKIDVEGESAILVFSSVGYAVEELAVGNKTVIDVALTPDIKALEEIVVVGYGEQRKVNITGAVATIDKELIENRPITNGTQALQGVTAGVFVHQNSGQPGNDAATIRIRGFGTLGNNNALIIVDGIQGSLNDINPNDIENISVLKDAASASIYGVRGANGVVLVTTKRGKKGKMSINYNGYYGWQEATTLPDVITNSSQYMEMFNEAVLNEDPTATTPFTQDQINEFNTYDPYVTPNTDWNDLAFRTAKITDHNVTFSGGTDNVNYAVSLSYLNQEGIFIGTDKERYNIRINLDSKVSEKFNWGISLSGSQTEINEPTGGAGATITNAMRAAPMHVPFLEDGRYGNTWLSILNKNYQHPISMATDGENNDQIGQVLGNIFAELEIVKGLKFKQVAGVQRYSSLNSKFAPKEFSYDPKTFTPGAIENRSWRDMENAHRDLTRIELVSTLTYQKTWDNHDVSAMVGYNQISSREDKFNGGINGLPENNQLRELDAGSTSMATGGSSLDLGLKSLFGRLNYIYNNRYLFEANLRYDGSSRFAKENRWGFFPSASLGWIISEEAFLASSYWIDNLKLRVSYGQLGNDQITPFQYLPTISLGQDYTFNGQMVGGAAQTKLENPDITWETSIQKNIGLDLAAFKGKLGVELDYFEKETKDILATINISQVIGALSPPFVNLASVKNNGFEMLLNHKNEVGDWTYGADANFTWLLNNEVVDLPVPQKGYRLRQEGEMMDSFYAIKMLGVFQDQGEIDEHKVQPDAKPGDIKFEDFNDDGRIDNEDRQVVGRSIPEFVYGFSLRAGYKGFALSAMFQGIKNVNSSTEEEMKPFFNGAGVTTRYLDSWTSENKSNELPRLTRGTYQPNWRQSSFLVQDASYLRLKNVQFSYTFPTEMIKKAKMSYLKLYINAQNLLTFTNYIGLDPEKDPFKSRGSYPNVVVTTLGLNVQF
ncbi:MAG: TonB-dependent receptor [Cytophagales bacterium]|nr:TonB-dependent receptor [Cytophagales bacterium]